MINFYIINYLLNGPKINDFINPNAFASLLSFRVYWERLCIKSLIACAIGTADGAKITDQSASLSYDKYVNLTLQIFVK